MYREVEIRFKLKFESTSADFLAAAATNSAGTRTAVGHVGGNDGACARTRREDVPPDDVLLVGVSHKRKAARPRT